MSQSGCGPRWEPTTAPARLHSSKCVQQPRNAGCSLTFFLTWRNQKSCLSSKEQEHVRSFLVCLQRKQSTKLQRSLAWMCGVPTVPSMWPSIAPSRGSHPPARLCLSSPRPGVVKGQAAVQTPPLDLYFHTRFLAFSEFFLSVAASV